MNLTDNFGAGDMEPNAQYKWSNGKDVFVWWMTEEDIRKMWGGMGGDNGGRGGDAVNNMLHAASDWIWKNAGDSV